MSAGGLRSGERTRGNVLILSAGRRVSLLRGFQEAARAYPGCEVVAADANPDLSAACHAADAAEPLPRVREPAYADALKALCERRNIRLVVPTIDTELLVLADLREEMAATGLELLVSAPHLVATFGDKRRTAAFFRERGLDTPALYAPDEIDFPVFVKPYDGSLSSGAQLIERREDLTPAILDNPRNIYCEYVAHDRNDEFTCDLYFDRTGALKCVVPRRRIEVRGGEVAKAEACRNEIVDLLFDRFRTVEGARGVWTLQVFRHRETGALKFIEVNARFGGGYPLTRCAGADYQAWLLKEYLAGEEVDVFHGWTDGMKMLRYDAEVIVSP